jgi:phosphoglycerate dehydrogenase-like enzyme
MNPERLALMKAGSYIYNFGRGNSLNTNDLLTSLDHLGGAFLDVTDEEPLPRNSPLWDSSNVMITPHSSCIYHEYKSLFINEVIDDLKQYF